MIKYHQQLIKNKKKIFMSTIIHKQGELSILFRLISNTLNSSIFLVAQQIVRQFLFIYPFKIYINILQLSMKPLKILGILLFYIHYYVTLSIYTLCNLLGYIWSWTNQSSVAKPHINPYKATHSYVFAHINQVIFHQGYSLSTYKFQTADGAELMFWRINKQNTELLKPYPIVLVHGLLDCSVSWFLHIDKSKSLPYMLASQGYDIWIGNNRGNRLSRNKNNDEQNYWQYNFDHLVQYDQPTIINNVLRETGKSKLVYIGHSQGSTQFLLGLGIHHSLTSKIAGFIGLGTVVSLQNVKSHLVLRLLSKFKLLELYRFIGFNRILVLPSHLSQAVGVLIYNSKLHYDTIMYFIRLLCGFNVRNKIAAQLFGVVITHQPGGASTNNALHWIQCFRQGGVMKKFDLGKAQNLKVYGSEEPPKYCLEHLRNLPFNSYVFRGLKDAVMNKKDFQQLVDHFPQDKIFTYDIPDYNHLDYVWSESAHHDLYGYILEIISGCDTH